MILLNGREVVFGRYPNGEMNLPLADLKIDGMLYVKMIYENDSDLLGLLLLADHLKRIKKVAELFITYMPYSRMDRKNNVYAFSLESVCNLINSMNFKNVIIREPHSLVTHNMINNSRIEHWCSLRIMHVIEKFKATSLFFPDAGAAKRYNLEHCPLPFAVGKKTQDFKTGQISSMALSNAKNVGKRVLIVDDMCSMGSTFVEAAKLLREHGAKQLALLVAYCEDNVFSGELFDHIDLIYTSPERELQNDRRIVRIP